MYYLCGVKTNIMEDKNTYVTSKFKEKSYLEETTSDNFGFDWNTNSYFEIIGDKPWEKTRSGLIEINRLIDELVSLREKGSNYVGCEYHCDHRELELFGFELTSSTQEEIDYHKEKEKEIQRNKYLEEIKYYQKKIDDLSKFV